MNSLTSIKELLESYSNKRLRECFGTGPAATVSHVKRIQYQEQDLILPGIGYRTIGPAVRERLVSIMTGRSKDPYGWIERV